MATKTVLTRMIEGNNEAEEIAVDAEIALLIQSLWNAGIFTTRSHAGDGSEDAEAWVMMPLEEVEDLLLLLVPDGFRFSMITPEDLCRYCWSVEVVPWYESVFEWEAKFSFPARQIGFLTRRIQQATVLED